MTTDLRAALREALQMAADALPLIPEVSVRDAFARLVAIADAPPTVAELLLLVDATHEVRWTDSDGDDSCATTEGETDSEARVLVFRRAPGWDGADHEGWSLSNMHRCDLTQPARLVEVA